MDPAAKPWVKVLKDLRRAPQPLSNRTARYGMIGEIRIVSNIRVGIAFVAWNPDSWGGTDSGSQPGQPGSNMMWHTSYALTSRKTTETYRADENSTPFKCSDCEKELHTIGQPDLRILQHNSHHRLSIFEFPYERNLGTKMGCAPVSPISPRATIRHNRKDDDAVSMLSDAAPPAGYQAYRPPPPQHDTPSPMTSQQQAISCSPSSIAYIQAPTSPTPHLPAHNHMPCSGNSPRCPPSSPRTRIPSLGLRSQLFGDRDRGQTYTEVVPWAESTQFRTPSRDSRPGVEVSICASQDTKQYHRSPRHLRRTWRAGGVRRFPWQGAVAMGILCLLTGSCIALLYASDKSTPESWPADIQPHTYLSIMEIFMCLMTLGALGEGVAISFWTRLLRGTTIGKLHDVHCSSYLWTASGALARLRVNKVGFATLVSAISLSRGPLFQCALMTREGKYELHVVYMALGMIVSYASLLPVISLYHGYWHLGRPVSLNPLEIARAFGAPMFEGLDGNVTAQDIELENSVSCVRYGAVERHGKEKVLRVENTERTNVRTPKEGEIFG